MYVDTPTGYPRDDGDFPVRVNPGIGRDGRNHGPFAVIDLNETGDLSLRVDSLADADRLLHAAETARAKLKAYLSGTLHAFKEEEDWRGQCVTCGAIKSSPIHQAPEPEPAGAPSAAEVCAAHHPQGRQS